MLVNNVKAKKVTESSVETNVINDAVPLLLSEVKVNAYC